MMQKQFIKYSLAAFSGALLFTTPICAAEDPCAEGYTCVWSIDENNNLTIESGTYKDNAFSWRTLGNINIVGDNVSLAVGSFRNSTTGNVKVSGNNVSLGWGSFLYSTTGDVTISGNYASLSGAFLSCKSNDILISGNNASIDGGSFRYYSHYPSVSDSITIKGNNISIDQDSFEHSTTGELALLGDKITGARFQAMHIGTVLFAGANTSLTGNAFLSSSIETVIISDGTMPSWAYRGGNNTTFVCSEADKLTCQGLTSKVETYTYDEKTGLYNYKHKRYADPKNILTGDYVPRRIYTIEEALEVVSDKGNSFMLRYK